MVDWIIEAMQYLWGWLVEVCKTLADAAMNGFIHDLPVFDNTGLAPVAAWLEVANQWLPIDCLMAAVAAQWTFVGLFIVGKYAWKALPGTG